MEKAVNGNKQRKGPPPPPLSYHVSAMIWMLPLCLWVCLMNMLSEFTWGYGRLTFFTCAAVIALLVGLHRASSLGLVAFPDRKIQVGWPRILIVIILSFVIGNTVLGIGQGLTKHPPLVDISANTHAASALFADGKNPYASKAQLSFRIRPVPNVEIAGDDITMFGVPYYYGYPYFPAMFLSHMPTSYLIKGENSIRIFNLFLFLLNVVGILILTSRLANRDGRFDVLAVALIAYLCIRAYPREIFEYGIVDILVSTYTLYAFIAVSYKNYWAGGILFGLAQASKLLPGPLVVLPVVLFLWGKPGLWQLVGSYLAVSVALLAPFVLWNPEAFLSATVLYYLTCHAAGDNTSLWFFLPKITQSAFLVVGFFATLTAIFFLVRPKRGNLLHAVTAAFAGYLTFIAFSRMIHLNYVWSIYPLGCVAFALLSRWPSQPKRVEEPRGSRPSTHETRTPAKVNVVEDVVAGKVIRQWRQNG